MYKFKFIYFINENLYINLKELKISRIKDNEVLIKFLAASINPFDINQIKGIIIFILFGFSIFYSFIK